MGNELNKVASGQPFRMKAATFNAFVDAARDYQERASGTASTLRRHDTKSGILFVRNDSGSDQDQFAVLGVDDLVINPGDDEQEFRARVVLSGKTPDKAKHRGRFSIYAEPVEAGKIGKAYVDDVAQVRLLVPQEQEDCRFAEIDDGTAAHLKAANYGSATILWREGGTGEQWAVVRIGKLPPLFPVKLETAGGEQGDDENPATWTYNVYDLCTNELLLEYADPVSDPHKWQRPSVGWMIEATFGHARFDDAGELVLTWINEMVDQEKCEEDEGSGGTPTG
ncbi:MAG: hypothetical protein AB7F75_00745 [Planctomycetota bacterium]